ncbi:MAG: DUF1049 domain-containing protein [Kastovskya adunca ATA6-11-RM4]|jgi:uncharacterized integral membrane protein|nr:DUF1049 domain-containing protein [Kastovskya adunca ATA6-11-RM4]
MKTITNLLTSLILAAWVIAIAIISIQNIKPVSLRFLTFQSIELPIGVMLAFGVAIGAIAGAIIPLFWRVSSKRQRRYSSEDEEFEEEF